MAVEVRRPIRHFLRGIRLRYAGRFGQAPAPEKWLFIVGCYNSGTSLLHRLVSRHSSIGSLPTEGQFLTDQLVSPQDVGFAWLWATKPEHFLLDENSAGIDVERMKRQWGAYFNRSDAPVLVEKTTVNGGRTRWLQHHFENAHFVGIIRNGYVVAEGVRRHSGASLELAAEQWKVANTVMLQDWEHLRNKVLIRYEDLVDSPMGCLDRVGDLVGLDASEWNRDKGIIVRGGRDRSSMASLTEDERRKIERVAADLLEELGYAFEG